MNKKNSVFSFVYTISYYKFSSCIFKELMQPLLEIIRACLTSKDFTTLGERTQGIFKNKLCSIKEVCRYLG